MADGSSDRWISEEELQRETGEDRSFGGWRDWILLIVGVPFFLTVLVAAARIGIGSMKAPWIIGWPVVGVVVVAALVVGLLRPRR
jgi:hypothetical protein